MIFPTNKQILNELLSETVRRGIYLGVRFVSIKKYLTHLPHQIAEMVEFPKSHNWMPIGIGGMFLPTRPEDLNHEMFALLKIRQCHVILQHGSMEK